MTRSRSVLWALTLTLSSLSSLSADADACDACDACDAVGSGSGSGSPAAGSALITSKTSFAKAHCREDPPGLWEESESFLMETDTENTEGIETKDLEWQSISTEVQDTNESKESREFCSLLLVLRSILVALLLHLAVLVYKRKTWTEKDMKDIKGRKKEAPLAPKSPRAVAATSDEFCSKLHIAAASNLADLADLLASRADVNATDAWDETALHLAARFGRLEACELLIDAKADVNAVNADDLTPLAVLGTMAGSGELVDLCHQLLHQGAVLNVSEDQLPPQCTQALLEKLLSETAKV